MARRRVVVMVRVTARIKLGMNKVKDEIVEIRSRMIVGVMATVRVRVGGSGRGCASTRGHEHRQMSFHD